MKKHQQNVIFDQYWKSRLFFIDMSRYIATFFCIMLYVHIVYNISQSLGTRNAKLGRLELWLEMALQ